MPAFGRPALALPAAAAVVLVPWTIGIATRLPHSAVARHWNIAWAGIDVAIMVGLTLTSWLARQQDRRAALTATATAALMCADVWFDLCTSGPGPRLACAVAEAATEVTVAAACLDVGLRGGYASAVRVPARRRQQCVPGSDQRVDARRDGREVPLTRPARSSPPG